MGIEIHCNKGCEVKHICKKHLEVNVSTLFRNTDIGVPGCLVEILLKNLVMGAHEHAR